MSGHIFTYWHGDPALLEAFLADWREGVADIRHYDDTHVIPILSDAFPHWLPLYERIALPACRSDIARLLLLHRHGGFYTDAHTGRGDPAAIRRLLSLLTKYELVVFIRDGGFAAESLPLRNGTLLGRSGAAVLVELINAGFRALLAHLRLEAGTAGYVPYNVSDLTGTGLYTRELFRADIRPFELFASYRQRVHCESVSWRGSHQAFEWYRNYNYRRPGQHWSERQTVERLFDLGPKA